jgi:hypothetical protein
MAERFKVLSAQIGLLDEMLLIEIAVGCVMANAPFNVTTQVGVAASLI